MTQGPPTVTYPHKAGQLHMGSALLMEALDLRHACFGTLSMTILLNAIYDFPQPEPVEGRTGGSAAPYAIASPSMGEGRPSPSEGRGGGDVASSRNWQT